MAPLRSSRTTRNAEHNTAARNRGGVFDFDPTDGLPVRKYVLETVKINQDATLDPIDAANKEAADKQNDFPWPEHSLPTFFESLPPHSQELLRRARQGDLDAKPSVWDRKKQEWVRADKAKSRGLGIDALKSRHLMNVDLDQDQEDAEDEEEGSGDDEFGATTTTTGAATQGKKRKLAGPEERIIEIKKWVQVPLDKADKMPEPKYVADRRPGLGSLYTPAYLKTITAYGPGVDGVGSVSGAGFDLGDGGGLGNALGGAGAPAAPSGEMTPVRKNMPPKRKKKGGPGRKKAVPVNPALAVEGAVGAGAAVAAGDSTNVGAGDPSQKTGAEEDNIKNETGIEGEDGDEGSGDESEGEGSEEGEVNEDPPSILAAVPITTASEPVQAEEATSVIPPPEILTTDAPPEIALPISEPILTEIKDEPLPSTADPILPPLSTETEQPEPSSHPLPSKPALDSPTVLNPLSNQVPNPSISPAMISPVPESIPHPTHPSEHEQNQEMELDPPAAPDHLTDPTATANTAEDLSEKPDAPAAVPVPLPVFVETASALPSAVAAESVPADDKSGEAAAKLKEDGEEREDTKMEMDLLDSVEAAMEKGE